VACGIYRKCSIEYLWGGWLCVSPSQAGGSGYGVM